MAAPYIKNDGVNYKIQAGLPSAGVATLQFTDSASSPVITVPNSSGTMALTTISAGVNALPTTDMAAAFRTLDGLVMPNVNGYLTNTPPASPSNGDTYIIGAAPTGVWAGQGGNVTRYSTVTSSWEFYTPKNGWMLQANSARESYRYTGGAWEINYQEGAFTSSQNGFTGVSSVGGFFVRTGNQVKMALMIQGSNISCPAGSYISSPFGSVAYPSVFGISTNSGTPAQLGQALSGGFFIYFPSIPTQTATIVVSGNCIAS